jgi:hypothetical protein
MLTDLQHLVIEKKGFQLVFDIVYILGPATLLTSVVANHKAQHFLAIFVSFFSFIYAMTISSMSTLSIQAYMGWILIPLIFAWKSGNNYNLMVEALRYFFILIFLSAGLWKIRGGGIFYPGEMAGILLKQHTSYLVSDPADWFSRLVFFMSNNSKLSWCLYAFATVAELVFVIGFFTKKYDTVLIAIFVGFVLFNYFFMRINYVSWIVFTGCFWFARKKMIPVQDGSSFIALKEKTA